MIVILRPDHTIVYFSPFAERLTGYSAAEVRGRDYLDAVRARGRPARRRRGVRAGHRRHAPPAGFENPVVCRDGSRRWIVWNARYLPDYEDGPAILKVGQDITFLKQAQERALQAERLAAIGQMVAGLAHESRNALQRSQACLEMLALAVARPARGARPDRPAPEGAGPPPSPLRGCPRLRGPDQARATSRATSRAVWREAWAHLEPAREGEAGRRSARRSTAWTCAARRTRSASSRSSATSSRTRWPPARPPVAIEVRCRGRELDGQPALRVAVRDNGPGLDPEQRQQDLRPVLHHQGQGDRPGHGHRQADRRGPRGPDRGRRRRRARGATSSSLLPRGTPMNRSLKIAVADDELDMRDYFQQILPLLGHQVVAVAETGRELVEQCRGHAARPGHHRHQDARHGRHRRRRADLPRRPDPGHPRLGLPRPRVHPPRRGGPHPGLPGQADQAGRPRAGDRASPCAGSSSSRRCARRPPT